MQKKFLSYLSFIFLLYASVACAIADIDESSLQNSSFASNPAAVNILTGNGLAQEYFDHMLGITDTHGVRVGGLFLTDADQIFTGGIPDAQDTTSNVLFLLGVSVHTEQAGGWKGGLFDIEFLQFNGQPTNKEAGTVQGYNSIPGPSPLNRSELYKLWYRQEFFDKKLFFRIGKMVPSMDFNNLVQPIPMAKDEPTIPAVTGLMFTPIFVNASMLGILPGYYNSAYGVEVDVAPVREWYLTYGYFDGNLANGTQTGLTGPNFNGNYFQIAETGLNWKIGKNNKPGDFAVGVWHQTGLIQPNDNLSEQGASGVYVFGTQRIWYRHPGVNNSGVSGFYQFGQNNSDVMNMTRYFGAGFTGFGLVPGRANDSMGVGGALSWLNQTTFSQNTELLFQFYYQAQVYTGIYLQPAITYIPNPAAQPNLDSTWTGIVRAIIAF